MITSENTENHHTEKIIEYLIKFVSKRRASEQPTIIKYNML